MIRDLEKPQVQIFIRIKQIFAYCYAIVYPPFWILKFWVICDLDSPQALIFIRIKEMFTFWSAILDPLLQIPKFWVEIRNKPY